MSALADMKWTITHEASDESDSSDSEDGKKKVRRVCKCSLCRSKRMLMTGLEKAIDDNIDRISSKFSLKNRRKSRCVKFRRQQRTKSKVNRRVGQNRKRATSLKRCKTRMVSSRQNREKLSGKRKRSVVASSKSLSDFNSYDERKKEGKCSCRSCLFLSAAKIVRRCCRQTSHSGRKDRSRSRHARESDEDNYSNDEDGYGSSDLESYAGRRHHHRGRGLSRSRSRRHRRGRHSSRRHSKKHRRPHFKPGRLPYFAEKADSQAPESHEEMPKNNESETK